MTDEEEIFLNLIETCWFATNGDRIGVDVQVLMLYQAFLSGQWIIRPTDPDIQRTRGSLAPWRGAWWCHGIFVGEISVTSHPGGLWGGSLP